MSGSEASNEITELLVAVADGSHDAESALFACVYTELHRMACAAWRSTPASDTLQPTALVHEMYARLFRDRDPNWESRRHFFFAASRAMHDILVEQARRHASLKRGGGRRRELLTGDERGRVTAQADEIMGIREAVDALRREHEIAAQVLMLHYFGGLSHDDVAELLELSTATVRRRWAFAKSWIREYLESRI